MQASKYQKEFGEQRFWCVCSKKFPNSVFAAARAQPCFGYAALEEAEHLWIPLFALGLEDAQCFPGEKPVWFS